MGGIVYRAYLYIPVYILHYAIQYIPWYLPLICHLVMVAAQAYQVVIVQPSVVVLTQRCYMMDFYRLIVQPFDGVI